MVPPQGIYSLIRDVKDGTTKDTNVHDDGLSPSVMKALATESRRHRGKAFFSSPCLCASVVILFHGKGKETLFFALFVVPSESH